MHSDDTIELARGPYGLRFRPDLGASLSSLFYHDQDLLRTSGGPSVIECASFPLVPFANRIAGNGFELDGFRVTLAPNHPTDPDDFVLHGFGWLHPWQIDHLSEECAILRYEHVAGEWPWHFEARELLELGDNGLRMHLSVRNRSESVMPIGLGFHPFFPRNERTVMKSAHHGERREDGSIDFHSEARDWWTGKAKGRRIVDTTYVARQGAMTIEWPDRKLGVRLDASPELPHTHVYVPAGADFFCVEPVSHRPEAFGSGDKRIGFRTIDPSEEWSVWMQISAYSPDYP